MDHSVVIFLTGAIQATDVRIIILRNFKWKSNQIKTKIQIFTQYFIDAIFAANVRKRSTTGFNSLILKKCLESSIFSE